MPPLLASTRRAWPGQMPSDRAACGMGFVATPGLGHESVSLGVQALARLSHRGGLDADGKSGDGAGLLIQVPHRLLGGEFAVAVLFEWDGRARAIVAEALEAAGLALVGWRAVPVEPDSLGERARATMPAVWHGLVARPDLDPIEWEHRLYLARRRAERRAADDSVRLYMPSCSSRTVVYKGLMAGTRLADFYLDLRDGSCESRLAVFHQRYSTNTMPDWRLAQPFRLL
ncbi:MAG TPA: glutamate synthase subunit alpha, partial [Candidatus Dormibacteraeota bacterium]